MAAFSQYIIYADESGSPVLGADATDFPVFVLVFVIVQKKHYVESLVPKVQMLKFNAVGHDQLILHERDIRRQANAFAFLQVNEAVRNAFIAEAPPDLKHIIGQPAYNQAFQIQFAQTRPPS
jgi:hypothetical protein